MPFYVPGDPNPRKTPAELAEDQASRPVVTKIDDEMQQIASREPDYVWAAIAAFLIVALGLAIRGCG